MTKLLRLELRKLSRQTSFYICVLVMIAMLLLSTFTYWLTADMLPVLGELVSLNTTDYMLSALVNGGYEVLLGIFVALFVCTDHTQKTIRTVCARGYSRASIYLAKLIAVLVGATVLFVLCVAASLPMGALVFGGGSVRSSFWQILFTQYLSAMALTALYFGMSILVRKSGLAVTAAILVPMVMALVFTLIDTLLVGQATVSQYWLGTFITELSTAFVSQSRIMECLWTSLVCIPLFGLPPILVYKHIEL